MRGGRNQPRAPCAPSDDQQMPRAVVFAREISRCPATPAVRLLVATPGHSLGQLFVKVMRERPCDFTGRTADRPDPGRHRIGLSLALSHVGNATRGRAGPNARLHRGATHKSVFTRTTAAGWNCQPRGAKAPRRWRRGCWSPARIEARPYARGFPNANLAIPFSDPNRAEMRPDFLLSINQ